MFVDLLQRVLLDKLSAYGRDQNNNHVLSDDSIEDICKEVATVLAASLYRPSITVSFNEAADLAAQSGFKVERVKEPATLPLVFYHQKAPAVNLTLEINRLVDVTTQLILAKVKEHTSVKES